MEAYQLREAEALLERLKKCRQIGENLNYSKQVLDYLEKRGDIKVLRNGFGNTPMLISLVSND